MTTTNALVKVDLSEYKLVASDRQVLMENLAGESLGVGDLPRIKVPSSGALSFEIPWEDQSARSFEARPLITIMSASRWFVASDKSITIRRHRRFLAS